MKLRWYGEMHFWTCKLSVLWLFLTSTAIDAGQESYFPYAQTGGGQFQPQGGYRSTSTSQGSPFNGRPQQPSPPVSRTPSNPPVQANYLPQGTGSRSQQNYGYPREDVSNQQPQQPRYGQRDAGNGLRDSRSGQQSPGNLPQPQETEYKLKRDGNKGLLFDYTSSGSSSFPDLGLFSQLGMTDGKISMPFTNGNDKPSSTSNNFPRLGTLPPLVHAFRRSDPGETYGNPNPYENNPYPDNPYGPPTQNQRPARPNLNGRANSQPKQNQNQAAGPVRKQGYNSQPPNQYQQPPTNRQQNPVHFKQQNPVPNQPFSTPITNSGPIGGNKGLGAFSSAYSNGNSPAVPLQTQGSPQQRTTYSQQFPNNPQYANNFVQQPNNRRQQEANSNIPIGSLYPSYIQIKNPNPHGIQENQRRPTLTNPNPPQGVPPRAISSQSYPISSGGRPLPQQATNTYVQNQRQPQQNVNTFNNPPTYQNSNGRGSVGPGFVPYSTNGRVAPTTNAVHSGSQPNQPRVQSPPQSSNSGAYFPPPEYSSSASQSSGAPQIFRNSKKSSAANGGRTANAYNSNNKYSNGNNFSNSKAYSDSDGKSTVTGGNGGYNTRNQYGNQSSDQDSFNDRKTGGSQDSYRNQYNTNYNYDSKNNPSSTSSKVPVTFGTANQRSSATRNSNKSSPPNQGATSKPRAATSAASGTSGSTLSKPGNVFTDTFSAFKPQKSGGVFGNHAFPSFTQFLGTEVKNMF